MAALLSIQTIYAQTCSGNAVAVISTYGVSSPTNALGAANSGAAQVKTTGEFITLDLSSTLASGSTYTMTWARTTGAGGSSVVVNVLESTDGINFSAATGSPFTVTSTTFTTQNITASTNTRYIRISWVSGLRLLLDAVQFTSQTCVTTSTALTCSPSATQIAGYIYRDFNYNGVYDNGTDLLGVSGITVTAYNAAGTAFTGTSTANGAYTIAGLTAGSPYRLEFSLPGAWSSATAHGSDNGTTVQFVTAGTCANLGLANPNDYCQTDPLIVTPCYINGDPLAGGDAASADVFVGIQRSAINSGFDVATTATSHTLLGVGDDLGAVWGVAHQRSTNTIFTSAFTKRHMGFGPLGTGGIYSINPTTATVTSWLDVQTLGVSTGANPHTGLPANMATPSNDPNAVDAVGKIGLGDLDISDDGKTLYTINLANRQLLAIDIATKTLVGSPIAIPDPGCPSGASDRRPFGLAVNDGEVYVGVTCSGESTGNIADLKGYIMKLSGGSLVNFANFPIPATRTTDCVGCDWQAWSAAFTPTGTFSSAGLFPQPIVSDIEFDNDGSLIVALMDRWGHISGWNNYPPTGTTVVTGISSGDIIRLCNVGGVFTYQGTGACTLAQSSEYYFDGGAHAESTFGALLFNPSTKEITTPAIGTKGGGRGGIRNTNANGGFGQEAIIYLNAGTGGTSTGKANGLGDLEAVCNSAPMEIGNRVWMDSDNDGIQDPGEMGIANVTINLYASNGTTLLGTTSTNGNGLWYFDASNVTDGNTVLAGNQAGPQPETTYIIRVGTADWTAGAGLVDLAGKFLTLSNTGNGLAPDLNDNDAALVANTPQITVTTGTVGQNNHSLDMGFGSCPSILNPSAAQLICQGNAGTNITVQTDQNVANSIRFVRFNTDQMAGASPTTTEAGNIYAGAVFATVTPTGASVPYTATLTPAAAVWSALAPGTYYVYAILNPDQGATCRPVQEIVVTIQANPTANAVTLMNCPTTPGGSTSSFTLTDAENTGASSNMGTDVDNGASGMTVTYHASSSDAQNDVNPLSSPYSASNGTIVYARVEASNGCYTVANITLSVKPSPSISTNPAALCQGSAQNLISLVSNPGSATLSFYTSQANADAGSNPLINSTVAPIAATTYYVRAIGSNGCYATTSLNVTLSSTPNPTVTNGTICPGSSINLNSLVSNADGGTLSFYTTLSNAVAGTNALASSTVTPAAATTYYVRSTNGSGCYGVKKILVVLAAPNCGAINVSGPN